MLKDWLAGHKSLVATATSGSVVAALVATLAIVSGGYDAQRLDLGDGSVWVANGAQQVIGRANTEILELDTVVETTGTELEVVQDGPTVLLVDRSESKVDIVDPATAEVTESVPLPPNAPDVLLAREHVVIHSASTGEVWILPVSELEFFDAESEPTRSLGSDSAASMSPDGSLFLFSSEAMEVYRVDVTSGETTETSRAEFGGQETDVSISSIGGRWVLLDSRSGLLSIGGRIVDLAGPLGDATDAVVQEPSDAGDDVLVAYGRGLISVGLAGGDPRKLAEVAQGEPARPLASDECTFAAWSNGTGWRECDGDGGGGTELTLDGMPGGAARLAFARSGDRVVLNAPTSGGVWAVQRDGERIDNWDALIEEIEDQEEVEVSDDETPPEYEKNQLPPIAVDDEFGARPGRASILPVLLNDYDPNGDVLVVETVEALDESDGRLDVIDDKQRIQLTLDPGASGRLTFGYSITDGRGGTANATVTVTVRAPGENSAPAQVRQTRAVVERGGRVSSSVLGEWVDPDGDAFYLATAATTPPDTATWKPEGTVVFQEGGGSGERRSVALTVSDGRAEGTGSLPVSVKDAGQVQIIVDPFVKLALAGQEITVEPLAHVRGGSGTLRLSSVPQKPGATIIPSLETGTFRFTSDQVRAHYLEFVVNDGEQTVTGTVRIDVTAPPEANSTPITTAKTIFVRTLSSETIDVASSDTDPANGVLLVTAVNNIPSDSGVRAEVLEQRAVRVTLSKPLDNGPVTFTYRITNGLAQADGTITVFEIPQPPRIQPPVAEDDAITVRPGDAIDIPVLDNDAQPDGEELTLNPELVTGLRRESGILFASGDILRYLAPDRTGNFTAEYEIAGPDGQVDQAQVTIAVREAVEATNAAPVPAPIIARVIAGETVRIPVPLSGIDPDGDSVQLLGQETNPAKGSVTGVGADYIDYLAGSYSAGTDTFTYSLIDALGARASGTVRVGISPRANGSRNPVAVLDAVQTRPGKTVSVQVLANDSDPDGGVLSVLSVDPNSPDIAWKIVDDVVEITPPDETGQYGLVYTIQNALGGTSSNFITVVVDPDAPPSYPVAKDTVLTLSDILDRETLDVEVLRNVFFADGTVSSLDVSVLPGFGDTAVVTANKRIRVTVTERRQIIPFAVANPDDPSVVAYAFVWVPGSSDALPQLDRTARPITVMSEAPVTIDLNDYVIAVGGKSVRLADSTSVQATHASGDNLVVDNDTLRFTSADNYFGPASISFDVTDGESAGDDAGRVATLVLPIKVTPRANQPPSFNGGVIDFEPGETKSLDLVRLTTYPYDDVDELRFTAEQAPPVGFEYTITGSRLDIRADENVSKGTATALTIGVRDGVTAGVSGRIELNVVPSTRPLARPALDVVTAPRGQTTSVDVLANDDATNPFPGRPMSVVAIRGLDGTAIPAGVSVTPSADNRRLTVTVAASASPTDTNLQYQVADITNDPERYTFGSVRISVQDRPDTPVAPARADGGYEEGQLTLRLTAPAANNSPIVKYEVLSSSHGDYRMDCGTNLRCNLTDLVPGLRYQFSVVATNAVGASIAGPVSAVLSADYLPAAPRSVTAVPARGTAPSPSIEVAYTPVPNPDPGSAITSYLVRITGPGVDYSETRAATLPTTFTTAAGGALVANTQYVATVYAKNDAFVLSEADWRRTSSAPVTTIGPPSQVAVSAAIVDSRGTIQVTWPAAGANGGTRAVTYSVGRFPAGSAVPGSCRNGATQPGTADGAANVSSGWTDPNAEDGSAYQYVVYAENEFYCTPSVSGAIESKVVPPAPTAVTKLEANSGQFDILVVALSSPGIVDRFQKSVNGSDWTSVRADDWLTGAGDLSVYGNPQGVEYRACRDTSEQFCGPPTTAVSFTPINARATIASCAVGTPVAPVAPPNANLQGVVYSYAFNSGAPGEEFGDYSSAPGADIPPEPFPGSATTVRLRATVTLTSGASYADAGYVERVCS